MLIKSLEQMESIVKSNKDLSWDGWDVISLKPAESALMSKDGRQVDGKWFLETRFNLTENGWEIPNKIVG